MSTEENQPNNDPNGKAPDKIGANISNPTSVDEEAKKKLKIQNAIK